MADGAVNCKRFKSIAALVAPLTVGACGGRTPAVIAPADPATAVRSFLEAVRANSLVAMGELWGSSKGPAVAYMAPDELDRRLTVIRVYLQHERFAILPPTEGVLAASGRERVVRVRLVRRGCAPVVPFTLGRYKQGWLIYSVDLAAAGNPARPCPAVPDAAPTTRAHHRLLSELE